MLKKLFYLLTLLLCICLNNFAQDSIEIMFEDYNDQDIFNNFSGDWNRWSGGTGEFNISFDTINKVGDYGAGLKLSYSVPTGGYGGLWISLISKVDCKSQYLDFTDLYRKLINSNGNPTEIDSVRIIKFNFWAKGNGSGNYNHVVKIEVKDINDNLSEKEFTIPNTSNWTKYEFPVSEMSNVEFTQMKQITFVLSDYQNDNRTSHFFLDNLSFFTDEPAYDANVWNNNDEFLDLIAHRAFNYFLIFHDTLGFTFDRSTFSDLVSVGAIGFQLAAYCIGHKRSWADKDYLESQVEKILTNLNSLPMGPEVGTTKAGYNGFFYHFLNANTGLRKNEKVELSLYDTMLMMWGILICMEYFNSNSTIQSLAQSLYDAVQWNWMVDTSSDTNKYQFYLGWMPEINSFIGHADGYTDEALLVDVLALGSTTYSTTMATYNARKRYIGCYPQNSLDSLAAAWTGSMFNYFFASCFLNLEKYGYDKHDSISLNIWENNKRAILANYQFCKDSSNIYSTYNDSCWGLTACDNLVDPSTGMLSEYLAFGALPTQQNIQYPQTKAPHVGTIAIYGPGSAIMYTPEKSINALRYFYQNTDLWNPLFGLGDAYSQDPHYYEVDPITYNPILDADGNLKIHPANWINGPWVNHMVMGVDQGPLLLAIENYRSKTIWELSDNNHNIKKGINSIFDTTGNIIHYSSKKVFVLNKIYPNPLNSKIIIRYTIFKKSKVVIKVFNILGQEVRVLVNDNLSAGTKTIIWDGKNANNKKSGSGIYLLSLKINDLKKQFKFQIIK